MLTTRIKEIEAVEFLIRNQFPEQAGTHVHAEQKIRSALHQLRLAKNLLRIADSLIVKAPAEERHVEDVFDEA